MTERFEGLLTDCRLATMVPGERPFGVIEDGAVLIREERIAWVGPRAEAPAALAGASPRLPSIRAPAPAGRT